MKTVNKEVVIKKIESLYVCETCGKESEYEPTIASCELKHIRENCTHEFFKYDIYFDEDINIDKICKTCGVIIQSEYIEIDDIPDRLIEELLNLRFKNV